MEKSSQVKEWLKVETNNLFEFRFCPTYDLTPLFSGLSFVDKRLWAHVTSLKSENQEQKKTTTIIFTDEVDRTKNWLILHLKKIGFDKTEEENLNEIGVFILNGDKTPVEFEETERSFRQNKVQVLLATKQVRIVDSRLGNVYKKKKR